MVRDSPDIVAGALMRGVVRGEVNRDGDHERLRFRRQSPDRVRAQAVRITLLGTPSEARRRARREARARMTVPPQHRLREAKRTAPPPAPDHDPGNDDAARDALRTMQRP